jgi:glyoxylase-like metal-dependent hydrolase (beta-lactamase superfamily II)
MYRIRPVPLFEFVAESEKSMVTYLANFGQTLHICTYVWFIEGGTTNILVDAGGTASMFVARGRPKEQVTDVQSLEAGLGKLGLRPDDIDAVVFTHLHWDHVQLAHQFREASLIVQRTELAFAQNPHPVAARHYDKKLLEGLRFEVVDGDTEIANGIRLMLTPGHSPGTQSVAIETEKGTIVVAGFCCLRDNFEPSEEQRKVCRFSIPGIHTDTTQAYDSMVKVAEAADTLIAIHDPYYAQLESIPEQV